MSASEVHQESLDSWSTNAEFWDSAISMGGNDYWQKLQEPCLGRFFADHLKPGCRALDLSTGNGLCARWMASRGAKVIATDGAPGMLKVAKARTPPGADISFSKLDVTDPADFATLLESPEAAEGFDLVLMNMAIMDVSSLDALAEALPRLLKKNAVFVGTLLHPVFFTPRVRRIMQVRDDLPKREVKHEMVITNYLHVAPWKGWASQTQPALQHYFHRPLHELLGTFFKVGLVMDGIEEPTFSEGLPSKPESSHNWATQFPSIFAFRLRRIY
ncbi:S-adenosyl-L-methionine-dependent methyltransferase [Thozetella sp. PMI_491]|nr:S-adenosyl-L-methionine-dependent methyltransferase [Thozetella sp. PMI_491]